MPEFSRVLSQGASHGWLFVPSAILLGALHGLEPGHSKTMMAAFIVAIRGTIWQAVLLGLSAACSHSLIIWGLAAIALKYGSRWNAETTEPYFQLASAAIIAGLAIWMFWRTRRDSLAAAAHEHHHPGHEHGHSHEHSHCHDQKNGGPPAGGEFQDAHEAAHAMDIQKRFMGRQVTTLQIILFGLTGGLLPCPAAFTVLLVCMQVKQFTLGFALVAAFSFGLAITMVTVGAIAAWSVQHAERKFRGFGDAMRKAPYFSCALLIGLAFFMAWQGWHGLPAHQ
jgi:ABC-type nickel/cobalt efflux system permease component RcnA